MKEVASDDFVAWHFGAFGFCNLVAPECYMRWLAWKESRAALCVELPPELHAYTGQPQEDRILDVERNHTIKQCRQSIESAGVKCK